MAWKARGSVSDRLRALKFRSNLLIKQDPMMASMEQQPPMNVQPPTAEAAGGIPGMGKPPKSDLGMGLDSLLEPFTAMDANIATVKLLIDQQGIAGVLPEPLEELENDMLELETIMMKIKQGIRRMAQQHSSLGQHDANQMVGPAANEQMMEGGM